MKILIIGSKGMLARAIIDQFVGHDLVLWDKEDIDITSQEQVKTKVLNLKPDLIINCAAFTKVDDCETNKDLAMAVNGQAVGNLADLDIPLVHISTDYVFDGKNQTGYEEDSKEFGPVNVYGESKLSGEQLLMNKTEKFYLIRTSWLYGEGGPNFVATMLKLAQEKSDPVARDHRGEIKVVNDQFGKPTYTVDVAKQIRYIIDNKLAYGIYHAVNETAGPGISWYEFAQKIFELSGLKVNLIPISSGQLSRSAQRPAYSALLNTKLPKAREYQDALSDYLKNKK